MICDAADLSEFAGKLGLENAAWSQRKPELTENVEVVS